MSSDEIHDKPEVKETMLAGDGEAHRLSPSGRRAMQRILEKSAMPTDTSVETFQVHDVPLARINSPDVRGPADFRPDSYEGLRQELERLQHLKPHIEAGQGEVVADDWDRQLKMGHYNETGYRRGYTDVYKTYYETDPVALSPTPSGQYDITDGRHRV